MSARPKPRVEPLSRQAWERVEAGVFDRLARGEHRVSLAPAEPVRRARRAWAAGAAALAAAAALLLWWPSGLPEARLAASHVPATTEPAAVAPPAPFAKPGGADGTHIVTTAAPTRTTIGEATLLLAAESDVHVAGSDAGGWLVRLDRGEVDCAVAPRHGRPPFVVQAGETTVTVVGTRFTVQRDGGSASVRVLEGRVQVTSGTLSLVLGPGERWPGEPRAVSADDAPAVGSPKLAARGKRATAGRSKARAAPAGQQFEQAARLEATDPDAALAIYRKLVDGKGRWAANALYAEARLELERGHRERARERLHRYLARYPAGANEADVRALLRGIDGGAR